MPARALNRDQYQHQKLVEKNLGSWKRNRNGVLRYFDATQPPALNAEERAAIPQVTADELAESLERAPSSATVAQFDRVIAAMRRKKLQKMRDWHKPRIWRPAK